MIRTKYVEERFPVLHIRDSFLTMTHFRKWRVDGVA